MWSSVLIDNASGYGKGWRTLVLLDCGLWDPDNLRIFPKMCETIYDSGVLVVKAFFASTNTKTDIKLHSNFTKFVLTSHLTVQILESSKNKCRLLVRDNTCHCIDVQLLLFDTSIMHNTVNKTDKKGYILMFCVWHPDLT